MSAVALTQPFDFRAMDEGFNRIADFGLTSGDYGFLNFAVAKSGREEPGCGARLSARGEAGQHLAA